MLDTLDLPPGISPASSKIAQHQAEHTSPNFGLDDQRQKSQEARPLAAISEP